MGETGVSASVRGFIASHIVSVAQLDVLLLLRAASDKEWTAPEVARALVTQPEAAGGWLEDLRQRGFASEREGSYRYTPATAEVDGLVDALAESYANYRVAVIGLIFARPSERITSFADAFRIRKKS